jgi:uncharacterized protein YeaO (DUF488 family)
MLQTKRAYEPASKKDGYRVLVDRLWPRGMKKSELVMDEWAKDLAPSTELRRDFGHDPKRWSEFQTRYRRELQKKAAVEQLDALANRSLKGPVTLIYSAKDEEHNDAVVLKRCLDARIKRLEKAPDYSTSSQRQGH